MEDTALASDTQTTATPVRHSRWGLFLPVILLMLLVAGWSAFWFVARARTTDALASWAAREAEHGRHWTCPNQSVGGFPFRFELSCDNPTFAGTTPRGPVEGSLKRFLAVAQIYRPSHIIVEAQGPLAVRTPQTGESLELGWSNLDASILVPGGKLSQVSLVVAAPAMRAETAAGEPLVVIGETLEAHLRPSPSHAEADRAVDIVAKLGKATVPPLDDLLGTSDPADLEFQATVTRTDAFGIKTRIEELEDWRAAGGRLDVALLGVAKGPQRIAARGQLGLDDLHRPQGRIDAQVAGVEDLLRRFGIGGRNGLAGLLAGGLEILGGKAPQKAAPSAGGAPQLTALPPIRLENGRVMLGPIPLAGLRPLY